MAGLCAASARAASINQPIDDVPGAELPGRDRLGQEDPLSCLGRSQQHAALTGQDVTAASEQKNWVDPLAIFMSQVSTSSNSSPIIS